MNRDIIHELTLNTVIKVNVIFFITQEVFKFKNFSFNLWVESAIWLS